MDNNGKALYVSCAIAIGGTFASIYLVPSPFWLVTTALSWGVGFTIQVVIGRRERKKNISHVQVKKGA